MKSTKKYPTNEIPQANSMDTLERMVMLVDAGVGKISDLAARLGLVGRQGDYYARLGAVLGIVEIVPPGWLRLTGEGRRYCRQTEADRCRELANRVLTMPLINEVLAVAKDAGQVGLSTVELSELLSALSGLADSTASRRALCVRALLSWASKYDRVISVDGDRMVYLRPPGPLLRA